MRGGHTVYTIQAEIVNMLGNQLDYKNNHIIIYLDEEKRIK